MIFNSVTFLLFLTLVVLVYWNVNGQLRQFFLFCSSLFFYSFWRLDFVPLILLSTIVDFFLAQKIHESSGPQKSRYLKISIFINLLILGIFKYLIFFTETFFSLLGLFGLNPDPVFLGLVLPIGISFYTFQTISYSVDVYRGFVRPERRFLNFANYVTFFPQLVAGPILRAREVLPQLFRRPAFSWEFVYGGCKRLIYGVFLKVVVADNIAPLVDTAFAMDAALLNPLDVITISFLFGFQIYFDFSAYSYIAIGSAYLMGIRFPENFNFPYLSVSPREFWKRWHISLSSWIRDYLYLPLAKVKVLDHQSEGGLPVSTSLSRSLYALFLTWALMGFWHGANWTFLLWGLLHASIILVYRVLVRVNFKKQLNRYIVDLVGFSATILVMMLAWIPFRAESSHQTWLLFNSLFSPDRFLTLGLRENIYLVTALLMLSHIAVYWFSKVIVPRTERTITFAVLETAFLTLLIALSFVFLRPVNQFIYYQF